jgi:uncharacterized protein
MAANKTNQRSSSSNGFTSRQAVLAILFGVVFGFLLQKGGVAKYHILIGALLLQDFTVIKVMVSAIITAMLGLFLLQRAGKVEWKLKPTRYASVMFGGLIFGAGFACSGYCPGTGAAALGQMNWDALFMIVGMMLGSYFFAEASDWVSRKVDTIGDRGKLMLPDLLRARPAPFVIAFASLLVLGLVLLERLR